MNNISPLSQSTENDQQEFTSEFNIFKILGKDDKELIHSAFIQFLLENSYCFCEFFKIDSVSISSVVLEKAYTLEKRINGKKKKVRRRIDIEALGVDEKPVLVIENKFKSFPNKEQLDDYEEIYKQHYPAAKPVKVLFCFDKRLTSIENDWKVFDYRELLHFVKTILEKEEDLEKRIFIRHYYHFLSAFYRDYERCIKDLGRLLLSPAAPENKFWLRLMYSAVHSELEKKFTFPDFRFLVNPGNTSVPLMNVVPAHWTFDDFEFLIQFQGNDLKFYVHILNTPNERTQAQKDKQKSFLKDIIKLVHHLFIRDIYSGKGKSKNLEKMKYRSYYLYKENISSDSTSPEDITVEYLTAHVTDFYKKINEEIIPKIDKIQSYAN